MTAKSETVGVVLTDEQVVIAQGLFIYEVDYSPEENWRGVRLDNVRKLIDKHETAMAELESQRAEQWRLRREAEGSRDVALAVCASLRHERDVLISGLEALVGELDGSAKYSGYTAEARGAWADCARELRALIPAAANTESEEVKP